MSPAGAGAAFAAPRPPSLDQVSPVIYDVSVHLDYSLTAPTDLLLQIEIADQPDQPLQHANLSTSDTEHLARVSAEDGIGTRTWLRAEDGIVIDYSARVTVDRPTLDLAPLPAVPPHLLPAETVRYLLPSRYIRVELFEAIAMDEFGSLQGGAKIAAIRDWLHDNLSYTPGASSAETTAADTLLSRHGICRDFAHVMIALARASSIPARFASVYAPRVTPQDFHAVAEVYLDGTWHLVDATGMADPHEIARIGVGADAAEVSFLTIFGMATMNAQTITVTPA